MQEKKQKISPIKQRILYFADTLKISKREFYSKIGVSRGTLESHTGITEDIVAKFIATYPVVSLDWLLTGNGSMLKEYTTGISMGDNNHLVNIGNGHITNKSMPQLKRKNTNETTDLISENTVLKSENNSLMKENDFLKEKVKLLEKAIDDKEYIINILKNNS